MKINVFYDRKSFFGDHKIFTDEAVEVHNPDELKRYLKTCFSSMKKEFSSVSFQIQSSSGFYLVVSQYNPQADSFEVTYHERWNSSENPVYWSQKNISQWASDVLKIDTEDVA